MALLKKMGGRKTPVPEKAPEEAGTIDLGKTPPPAPAAAPTRLVHPEGERSPHPPVTRPVQLEEAAAGSPSAARSAPQPGEPRVPTLTVGATLQTRYQIESILGIGGMSVVYKGRDLRFRNVYRACAIKEMIDRSPDSQTHAITFKNFEREANLLANLNHPAIPKIYDYFIEGGRIYLVLEFVEGQNLEDILEVAPGPIEEEQVVRWALQICDVLSYLHNHKPEPIVFRDMKPSNVMISPDSRVVLIDFGIARIFEADQKGTMIGTEGYSPPEQYRGVAEPRGDIYALGATMHHLLTKSDPRLETPFTFHERPPTSLNPEVSPQLEAVIMKALEYDIRQRWASAAEMRAALLDLAHLDVEGLRVEVGETRVESTGDRLLWSFECEEEVRASPLVYNSVAYVGAYDNNLYAIDAETGKFIWKFPTQRGICSTASAWEQLLLFGSEDGAIYALHAQSGKVQWTVRTGAAVRSSPRLLVDTVYVGSDDQNLYALDPRQGKQLWVFHTWGPVRSSAAQAGGSVFIGSNDGHVYAVDTRRGEQQWKTRTGHAVVSSPIVLEGLVYVGSWDSYVYALDQRSGLQAWKYRTGSRVTSSPCVYGNRLFIGSADGTMYCLDTRNGRLIWKFETGTFITSSPHWAGGKVYFGAGNGRVYCLEADLGKEVWSFQTARAIASSPVVVEGVIYIGSTDKRLYALRG
jgi:outer membrane protein assembly factor BamB/tRNA A-37 threonylcarbamoyl transferase component Bud32